MRIAAIFITLVLLSGCAELMPTHQPEFSYADLDQQSDYLLCKAIISQRIEVYNKNTIAKVLRNRNQNCREYMPILAAENQQQQAARQAQQQSDNANTAMALQLLQMGQPRVLAPPPAQTTCQTYSGGVTKCSTW